LTDKARVEDGQLERTPQEHTYENKDRLEEIRGNKNDKPQELTNFSEETVYSKLGDRAEVSSTVIPKHQGDNKSPYWKSKSNTVLLILVILMLVTIPLMIVIGTYFGLEITELKSQLTSTKNNEPSNSVANSNQNVHTLIAELNETIVRSITTLELKLQDLNSISAKVTQLTTGIEYLNSTIKNITLSVNKTSPVTVYSSCNESFQQQCTPKPGYYQLQLSNGPPLPSYCSWTVPCSNITGGWMRVAKLKKCKGVPQCFENLTTSAINGNTGCVATDIPTPGCAKVTFSTPGLLFSHICGTVQGVAYGTPDGFQMGASIANVTFVDGISLILSNKSHLRHLHTLSAHGGAGKTKPCNNGVPEFVSENYQCMVTVHNDTCPITNKCSPFFHRDIGELTSGDIEMRICRDDGPNDEEIILNDLELYVL